MSEAGSADFVGEYVATLSGRSEAIRGAYGRILRQLVTWVAERPGGSDGFRPELLTKTAVNSSNLFPCLKAGGCVSSAQYLQLAVLAG